MESNNRYPSISNHYTGTSDGERPATSHNSIQRLVWSSPEKQKHTINGGQIDSRLNGAQIDVKVAEVDVDGIKTKVAVTCFENPNLGVEIQRSFPACRKAIVNRVFCVTDYDEADIIDAIRDQITEDEANRQRQ